MAAISRAPEVGAEAVDLGQIERRQHQRETRAVGPFEEYTTAGRCRYNRRIRFGQNDLGRQFEEGGLRLFQRGLFQRGLLSRWFGDRLFQSLRIKLQDSPHERWRISLTHLQSGVAEILRNWLADIWAD